jgi:TatD DNase family protein
MTDAHCHPWDLNEYLEDSRSLSGSTEEERRKTGTVAAASSWNREQFEYHESLAATALADNAPRLFCCFALHPQLAPSFMEETARSRTGNFSLAEGLELLYSLAAEGRLHAVGETGFDLYDARYRAAEKIQEEMFVSHLETALKYNLPMVLHVRKAMHKIFKFTKELKKLPAVVFHSWSGTTGEGEALRRKGINAFFSFGSAVTKNHREAMASAAGFQYNTILLETDAPYQPLRGKTFSFWNDLDAICSCIAGLRKEAGSPCNTQSELEEAASENFLRCLRD